MIEKVISGGQTGADIAGLRAAKACGIPTGGFIPKGYKTHDGLKPQYEHEFNLVAIDTPSYSERTRLNVMQSDCTIRLAFNFDSPGELCTAKYIKKYAKPYYDVGCNVMEVRELRNEYIENEKNQLIKWLLGNKFKVINIAGNREYANRGIEELVFGFLVTVFEEVNNLTVV